jgi:hypothetical protein
MVLVGLVVGRWWAVPLGGLAWAVLVLLAVHMPIGDVPVAAALGAANVAVGVVARQAAARITRLVLR